MTTRDAIPAAQRLHRPLFLWSLPFAFLYFGLPVISKEFGASAAAIGGLFSVFTATTLLLRPAVGWLLDRVSPRLFLVIALLFYAAAMGVFAYARSMDWLFAARIIQGIGSSFLWTSAYTIVSALTETASRGKAMGRLNEITTSGGLVGIFAAFFLMTILPEGHGWKVVFTGFSVLTLAGAVLAWRTVPALKPIMAPGAKNSKISRQLIRLLAIVFILGVPEAMMSPIYLTYLQDRFTTHMETLAWAFFPAALVGALFSARLGSLSDRFGRVPMLALGLAGAGVISFAMPHLPSLVLIALLYTISSVMWGISEPAETALVGDLTDHQRRGLAYGLYDFFENLGFTIGPLLGGVLYDSIGRPIPFYLNGAILIIGAGLVLLLLRPQAQESSPAAAGSTAH